MTKGWVRTEFAEKLTRERDELRAENGKLNADAELGRTMHQVREDTELHRNRDEWRIIYYWKDGRYLSRRGPDLLLLLREVLREEQDDSE